MTYDSVVQELDGLIDSLDEHVTIEDVGVALGELRANVFERAKAEKAHTPTDEREAPEAPWEFDTERQAYAWQSGWKSGFRASRPVQGTEEERETRDLIRRAVGGVLFNVSNFPEKVQTALLGQNMGPLNEKITDAVSAAIRRPVQGIPTDDGREAYELAIDMLEDLIVATGALPAEHSPEIQKTAGALVYKLARRPVQGEPTGDEREALFATVRKAIGHEDFGPQAWHLVSEAVLAAGFRRPAQAEPTDAHVYAAVAAFNRDYLGMYDDRMRAALRAAAAVTEQGENR